MANSKLQAIWNHPAGPKTIHFWAPTFKWGVSIANIIDSSKPPEQLSYVQQSGWFNIYIYISLFFFFLRPLIEIFIIPILFSPALTCNGLIWARNSLIITPKNWNLFSVSIGMAATSLFQLSRKIQ
ncbi:mitochondrial pyruvate carrier 4 isoform X1 [Prunus persica]|uniref:mitochondrial pyruvate carrier 4 isoform X1 n=1 Tax=Prunus persica TaxID=3760 RepID=UPI0009AB9980|nr:mitochondrial pyruvate carrier 4 isoform X1 [Prunus persica]